MIHLEVHSHFSMLAGTANVRQLAARAVEHGMKAIALTDTGGLYGAIPFYKAAKEAGLNPLLGAKLGPCVFLARDREGYAQLCEIISAVQLEKVAPAQFGAWPFPFGMEHLFCITADLGVARRLRDRGFPPLAAITHYGDAQSRYQAAQRYDAAQRLGLRAVAVNPVYFLDPAHYAAHRVLAAIRENTTVDQTPAAACAHPQDWFRSPEQMERLYAAWPEALDNACWVAEECRVDLALGTPIFPDFPLPPGETPGSWLWRQCLDGARARYHPVTPAVTARLRHELDVIDSLGFAPYFLIMGDIVRFAREHGIPATGRGSAANSLAAYVLGITRVDPLRYNLYFERFLNRSRADAPDIDLDLCWRRRDEVIAYLYAHYGAERVAMIAAVNTFQARSAVREAARAHGLSPAEIGRITRVIPHYGAGSIRNAITNLPECRGLRFDDEPLRSILEFGEFVDGAPRHLAVHAGGMIIAPDRLTRYVPLQRAAKGILITQYDKDAIEALGLVKMDLLGHRGLSVINDTVHEIAKNRGKTVDIEAIPNADSRAAALIRAGKTVGCFQIESPAMRGLVRKIGAYDTRTLIQSIALVRPGASGSGMKQHFIDRHHGREETVFLHPTLEAVLGDTYGVMIYQEDVLKVAHAAAGMDLEEADALRRAMSKKRSPREMAKSMKRFLEKARDNGVPEENARQIWELIANFAAYAYCKAHAATYGELAYQSAWLKAHYPAEFFAAVLSNRGGFYGPPVYLEEAKRCGIEIRPPDINRSDYPYTAEDDAVRMGFVEVRRLSQNAVEAILNVRRDGPFRGIADVRARARIHYADAEALFQAGAFDVFGIPRPLQYCQLRMAYQGASDSEASAPLLFAPADMPIAPKERIPDYSEKKREGAAWEALGMFPGPRHPFHYHLAALAQGILVSSAELAHYAGQHVTLAGWIFAERRLAVRDGSGIMKFLSFEDSQGIFEAVLFPEIYERFGHRLNTQGPYLVSGMVQADQGDCTLIVDRLECAARGAAPDFSRLRAGGD